jgi:sulfur-carrier protein adenylyltransferase/sulfurtransferase
MSLSPSEKIRYSRQTILPELGEAGQLKLKNARVLIVGIGGLGAPAALYLAAAGVGTIGLLDDDVVSISNLHRQIIYDSTQVEQPKVIMAQQRLKNLNPEIKLISHQQRLNAQNALKIFSQYDFVLDGADNFLTRYLVNDASFMSGIPLISASILGFEGQLAVFNEPHKDSLCYRCLYPEPPPAGTQPSCAEAGVLGSLPGFMGSLQATEVLKRIIGIGNLSPGQLLIYNALELEFHKMKVVKNTNCPLCGNTPTIHDLNEENFVCSSDIKNKTPSITAKELEARLHKLDFQLLDVREPAELDICKLPLTHHIPLQRLFADYNILALETPVIVYCKSGRRSLEACKLLQTKGYRAINLTGGILSWIETIDSRLTKY